MKPDWNDAPEWANYVAQDADGTWWWYEKEPSLGEWGWVTSRGVAEEATCSEEWDKSLEPRPR